MATFTPHQVYTPVTICQIDGAFAWCIFDEEKIYMANVWVKPTARKQGKGREMMMAIKENYSKHTIHTDYESESKGFWTKMFDEGIVDKVHHNRINFDWAFIKA